MSPPRLKAFADLMPTIKGWIFMLGKSMAQQGNFNGRVEIIHGLIPSVKCVAPLFGKMSLAKV